MPQLDVTTYPSQLVWLGMTFVLCYLLITYIVLPKMDRVFQNRWDKIEGTLERATHLNQQAETLSNEIEKKLEEARTKAHLSIQKAIDAFSETSSKELEKTKIDIEASFHKAEKKLLAEKDVALRDVDALSDMLATHILQKTMGTSLGKEEIGAHLKQSQGG